MAKRKLIAQLNPVNCKDVDSLELVTKPGHDIGRLNKFRNLLIEVSQLVCRMRNHSSMVLLLLRLIGLSILFFVEMLICVLCGNCPVIVKVES